MSILFIKLELINLISGEKVLTEIITRRRNDDFHFSPKGENGVQNVIGPWGVNCHYKEFTNQSKLIYFNFFFCEIQCMQDVTSWMPLSQNFKRIGI